MLCLVSVCWQMVKACPWCWPCLRFRLARGFDHCQARPPRAGLLSPVAWALVDVKARARPSSPARGAIGNRLALPDREGPCRSLMLCLVSVCWQMVKACPWCWPCSRFRLARGYDHHPASQPDRQGKDSFRLVTWPFAQKTPRSCADKTHGPHAHGINAMYGLPSRLFFGYFPHAHDSRNSLADRVIFGYNPLAYNSWHGMVNWLKYPEKAHSHASASVILPSASMMDTRSAKASQCAPCGGLIPASLQWTNSQRMSFT